MKEYVCPPLFFADTRLHCSIANADLQGPVSRQPRNIPDDDRQEDQDKHLVHPETRFQQATIRTAGLVANQGKFGTRLLDSGCSEENAHARIPRLAHQWFPNNRFATNRAEVLRRRDCPG